MFKITEVYILVNEEKLKALDAAISNIEKQFGKGSVMKLGDSTANMNVECIPTGSLSLDIALGLGGVPKGRVVRYMVLSLLVRLQLPFIWLQRFRREAE